MTQRQTYMLLVIDACEARHHVTCVLKLFILSELTNGFLGSLHRCFRLPWKPIGAPMVIPLLVSWRIPSSEPMKTYNIAKSRAFA